MGRRLRGAALRANKRSKQAAQEIVDSTAVETETKQVTEKSNDELFVLDTTAVLPSKKQQEKPKKIRKEKQKPSTKEQNQIDKLVQLHSSKKLKELVVSGKSTSKRAKIKGAVKANFDLWGDEPQTVDKKKSKSPVDPVIGSTLAGTKPSEHVQIETRPAMPPPTQKDGIVKVDVAKSGQSYNPDRVQHSNVLKDALQLEQTRQTAQKNARAHVSTGMSAQTRALLLGDSDTEESEDEQDSETVRPVVKQTKKLTRAQRNKQKRVRAEQHEIQSRKRQKKLQNSVGEAKTITKQLKREEADQKERKDNLEKLKAEARRTKGTNVYQQMAKENPIHVPTLPVALTSELKKTGGSLRTLKPKGSLISDRMTSLVDRDMAPKKQIKKRKRVEGKRRKIKVKVRGKGHAESKQGEILG